MRNVVVARDPAALRAAEAVLYEGANAVDMAVAGMLAGAVRASSSAILGGSGLIIVGTGVGRHWVDGRPRAPGVGAPRKKTPEPAPSHWTAAVPGFFQGVFSAHARFGTLSLMQLARAAIAAVREEGDAKAMKPRLALMEAAAREGLPGLARAGFVRAALNTVGPAAGGNFTEEDLALGPTPVNELVACAEGAMEVFAFPRSVARWSASPPDPLPELAVDALVACDKHGVFCAGSWLVAPEGPPLEGLPGLSLPALIPLPRKGITRWRPGAPLPVPFAMSAIAESANVFSACALTGRGDLPGHNDTLVNTRLAAIGTGLRVGHETRGALRDAKALWVQRELHGDRVQSEVLLVE